MQQFLVIGVVGIITLIAGEFLDSRSNSYPPQPFEVPEMDYPEGNEYSEARFELGRRLFYDKVMSVDSSIACASCHFTEYAFSDTVALSSGSFNRPGTRNAPTLANVGFHPYFTRDGSVPTLEMQILVPIQEHNEFAFNIVLIADRLASDSSYVEMSKLAYDRGPDAFVITRAIGCFERSITSLNSHFDQHLAGKGFGFSESADRGAKLFYSEEIGCSNCHSGFNFTNYSFTNNGLYEAYSDSGRFRFTNDELDRAVFKVPTLRNVGLTAPYMHDGSISTLEDVIRHYETGVKAHPNKSPLIKRLHITDQDREDLVAFLESLSDSEFVSNKKFTKPDYQ